jgi:IS5 family transposase
LRKRIGAAGSELLLAETIRMGLKTGTVSPRELQRVNVDTTVQEKAVRVPTDTLLCHKRNWSKARRRAVLHCAAARMPGLYETACRKRRIAR